MNISKLYRLYKFCLLLALISNCGYAQQFLQLDYHCKTKTSPFTSVKIIDKRPGSRLMGFVQKGAFNKLEEVKYIGNFYDTLSRFFYLGGNVAESKSGLAIILSDFFVSEQTESLYEVGRFKLALRLFFAGEENEYSEIMSVDTTYYITSGWDITKGLLKTINENLCSIANAAKTKIITVGGTDYYTMDELINLDSIEKIKIPMYMTDRPQSGVYLDYEHFKNNTPDITSISDVTLSGKTVKMVQMQNGKKKKIKKLLPEIYALCYENKLIKVTSIGLFQLNKTDGDFYFIGQTSFSNANNTAYWGAAFGLIGSAIAASADRNTQLYKFRIDYHTGHSIPISKAGNLPYKY